MTKKILALKISDYVYLLDNNSNICNGDIYYSKMHDDFNRGYPMEYHDDNDYLLLSTNKHNIYVRNSINKSIITKLDLPKLPNSLIENFQSKQHGYVEEINIKIETNPHNFEFDEKYIDIKQYYKPKLINNEIIISDNYEYQYDLIDINIKSPEVDYAEYIDKTRYNEYNEIDLRKAFDEGIYAALHTEKISINNIENIQNKIYKDFVNKLKEENN